LWCLRQGAEVNALTTLRCTPLHLAYLRNDKEVRRILKHEGNHHKACKDLSIIRIMELGRANRDIVNCYGFRPRDYLNSRKPLKPRFPHSGCCVEVVIEGFDRPFLLEIWYAARIGWLEVVKVYVKQLGCDIDIKSSNGQTPLMCACEHGQVCIYRIFLLSLLLLFYDVFIICIIRRES
jgi:ankyrin repeat protein